MSEPAPFTFRHRATGGALVLAAMIGVAAIQGALAPAPALPERATPAPIVLASHVADKVAVDVIEVERAMTQAGFRWEDTEHGALMEKMETMASRHMMRAMGNDRAQEDIAWAATRADMEVERGQWTVEAFDHWANSVANLEADVRADLGKMQIEVMGARLEEKERAAEIWHDVALTVEERPEVYMESIKAMQGTIGGAVWEFNNSLEVRLQNVVNGRTQMQELEAAAQRADLMDDYTLDQLSL